MNIGPNWKNAPPWAKFSAMDSHGAWHWYEEEPALSEKLGMWTARGAHFSVAAVTLTDWQNTLHARGEEWPKPAAALRAANADYVPQLTTCDSYLEGITNRSTAPVTAGDLLVLTAAAEAACPGANLQTWLDGEWTRDQLVAAGYAERLV